MLATAVLLIFIHLRLRDYAFDDAYIHFRIADHLATLGAPDFNIGERINASSSPMWTILLAISIKIFSFLGIKDDLPATVSIWNSLFTWGGALVYTALLTRLAKPKAIPWLRGVFFILYILLLLPASIGLMETPLALLLVGFAFHLLLREKPAAFTLLAAAVFLRLELIVPLGLACLYGLTRMKLRFWVLLAYTFLGLLPFLTYELYFYGTIIPSSILAKSVVYDISRIYVLGDIVCSMFACSAWEMSTIFGAASALLTSFQFTFILLIVLLCFTACCYLLKKNRPAVASGYEREIAFTGIFLLWGMGIAGAYLAARTFIFSWYVPLYTVPLTFAISRAVAFSQLHSFKMTLVLLAVPALLFNLLSLPGELAAAFVNPVYYSDFAMGARVRQYIDIGQSLYSLYPSATLLTSEIGGLGYGFKGTLLDGAGLVSPQALKFHPMKVPEERANGYTGGIPLPFIQATKPDLIVSYSAFIKPFFTSDTMKNYTYFQCPIFREDDLSRSNMTSLFGGKHLNVFIRNSLLAETPAGIFNEPFTSCKTP